MNGCTITDRPVVVMLQKMDAALQPFQGFGELLSLGIRYLTKEPLNLFLHRIEFSHGVGGFTVSSTRQRLSL
ncbi:MAG: hypothetical protein A4E36_01425 [Methanoregulaceae archaeon PtaB.Bin009]|nr:MAG: hypothetical protein A4E36_01425 [Methanoregulaceae archaeon PtaB.Bin009]